MRIPVASKTSLVAAVLIAACGAASASDGPSHDRDAEGDRRGGQRQLDQDRRHERHVGGVQPAEDEREEGAAAGGGTAGGAGGGGAAGGARPSVSSTNPAKNGTLGVNAALSVTFSNAMDASTLTPATFTLVRTFGGTPVAGSVSTSGNVAMFSPSSPSGGLEPNATYTATVTTGAKDAAGHALAADFSWTFVTLARAGGIDFLAPTVLSTNPPDRLGGVPINTSVSAAFSESMNASTLDATTFTLVPTDASAVPIGPAVPGAVSTPAISQR